jgi:prevent-host-death family protein
MTVTRVNMAEAKNRLSEIVNRVAYGGQRIILESRGKPKAVLVSVEDLALLETLAEAKSERLARWRETLAEADTLCEEILARRGGEPLSDSAEDLREIRERRLYELSSSMR